MRKVLTILTSVWTIFLILLAVFWVDLDAPFLPVSAIFTLVIFVLGAILILLWILSIRTETSQKYTIPIFAITFILGCSSGFVFLPDDFSRKAKFYLHKSSYEARVAEIYKMPPQQLEKFVNNKDCSVDLGPPIRVAFIWDGITDNWYGVMYDPSDGVQQADPKKWDDPSYQKLKRIFGGDLVSVRHIEGHWYFCWFT